MAVFFRQVHLVGTEHVPQPGVPVVFAGNHPNSLIDPVLVVTTSGRIVHFAAKDKLFQPPLGWVLEALGAVPIARRMDYAEGPRRDNRGALSAMADVLVAGQCIGIFPEGLSHDVAHLQRIRSGAARVALDAAGRRAGGVLVVPVGLVYMHRKRFRARVLVQYGEPIHVDETWVDRAQADPREAAGALTQRLDDALHGLTVNADDWDTLRVLDGVRRLYQPPSIPLRERVELARRFTSVYPAVRDEPAVRGLYDAVRRYIDELDRVGLSDRDLSRRAGPNKLLWRGVGGVVRLLVWLPLALLGAPVHVPLALLVGWAGLRFAPRKDVVGTTKLLIGLLLVLGGYVLLPLAAFLWVGWQAGLFLLLGLPLSGLATLRVLERGASVHKVWTSAVASLRLGRHLTALQERRGTLERRVVQLVARYKPEDMEALFPDRIASASGEVEG